MVEQAWFALPWIFDLDLDKGTAEDDREASRRVYFTLRSYSFVPLPTELL